MGSRKIVSLVVLALALGALFWVLYRARHRRRPTLSTQQAERLRTEQKAVLEQKCAAGKADACAKLGFVLAHPRGGILGDPGRGLQLYERACDMGSALGCANLGHSFEVGQQIQADKVKAARFYQRACDLGDPVGCRNLALLYDSGAGVPLDTVRGGQLLAKACRQGDSMACLDVGSDYRVMAR